MRLTRKQTDSKQLFSVTFLNGSRQTRVIRVKEIIWFNMKINTRTELGGSRDYVERTLQQSHFRYLQRIKRNDIQKARKVYYRKGVFGNCRYDNNNEKLERSIRRKYEGKVEQKDGEIENRSENVRKLDYWSRKVSIWIIALKRVNGHNGG